MVASADWSVAMILSRLFARFLSALLLISPHAGTATAESVYWNYGIGAIQTGWSDRHDGPIGIKTHLVGIGPDDASDKLQACIRDATILAATATQQPLNWSIEDESMALERLIASATPATQALLAVEMKKQTDRTHQLMLYVMGLYEFTVETCMKHRAYDANAVRLGLVTRVCASWFETEEPCTRPRDPVTRSQDPSTGRFAKLQEWLVSRNLQRPINEMIQFVPKGQTAIDISPDLRDRTYYPPLTSEQAEFYFEAGVDRLRRNGWKYDYTAPKAAGIDQGIAIALIDVVASPMLSIPGLRDEGRRLRSSSSEIVRNRIRECTLFRGLSAIDQIAACAGVANEAEVIRSCLGGAECRPELGENVKASALTINTVDGNLALSSPLPRILLDGIKAPQPFASARTCAEQSDTSTEFSLCFTESQLLDERSRQALQCARQTGRSERIDCMLSAIGGEGAEKARCLLEATGNAARARCVVSEDTPEEVVEALECASQPGASYESIGSCMVSRNIPGDAGRLASCAGSAGGDAMGAAICVAGNGLTPEQRILLQCAAQSADPSSYGVCVGGQLALKEFANCQNKNFAEGSCFGENNEIRKFVRTIGLGDIGPNSVVAQVLNLKLDVVKWNVRVAEGLVEGIGRFGEEAGKFLDSLVGDLDDLPDDAGTAACEVFTAGLGNCDKPWGGIRFLTAPDSTLAQMTGTAVSEIDASKIRLVVDSQSGISLGDGTTSIIVRKDDEFLSPTEMEMLDDALEGSSWQEVQSSFADDGSRSFIYRGEAAALDNAIAKALDMGEPNMTVIDSLKLERIGGYSAVMDQLRSMQTQSE